MNRRLLALVPALVLLAACASQPAQAPATVADTIARDPQLSTLNALVVRSGLADTLKAAGPYTVFAPTNDAFAAVPAKTMQELAANPARLKSVLSYHVLPPSAVFALPLCTAASPCPVPAITSPWKTRWCRPRTSPPPTVWCTRWTAS